MNHLIDIQFMTDGLLFSIQTPIEHKNLETETKTTKKKTPSQFHGKHFQTLFNRVKCVLMDFLVMFN